MIARYDHRHTLKVWALAALALATVACVSVLVAVLLTGQPTAIPSASAGGNPVVNGAGSSEALAAPEISLGRHAEVVASSEVRAERDTQMVGGSEISPESHAQMVAAQR